jgi:hypothetical protein
MVNKPALRDALLSLAEQCQFQYVAMSAISNEVAALRETLREAIGEPFESVFEKQQILQLSKTAAIESAAIGLLAGIIQRLKNGEVC